MSSDKSDNQLINGMLHKDGEPVPVREEQDLFDLIGVSWIEPRGRI